MFWKTPTGRTPLLWLLTTLLLGALAPAFSADAKLKVTVSLVKAQNPAETVDVGNEITEVSEVISQAAEGGGEIVLGYRVVCWTKNVQVDAETLFERRYKGKFLFRKPEAQVALLPGKHVLWPGNHEFEVTPEGKVVSNDPELIVEGASVKLKCYPVKMLGYWANTALSLPVSMRTFALGRCSVFARDPPQSEAKQKKRDEAKARKRQPPPPDVIDGRVGRRVRVDGKLPPRPRGDGEWTDLLPVYKRFAPLVVYLPANEVGLGYRFTPGRYFFRLSSKGVQLLNSKGDPLSEGVVDVNGYELAIPAYRAELVGKTRWFMGCTGSIGAVGKLSVQNFGRYRSVPPGVSSLSTALTFFHQDEVLPFFAGKEQPDSYLRVLPDFHTFPTRKFLFDNGDLRTERARRIEIDWKRRIFKAGEEAEVRAFFMEADECQTVESPCFRAYVNETHAMSPERARWQAVSLKAGEGEHIYRLKIPDLPTNVYTVRIALASSAEQRPDVPLALDFLISIHHGEGDGTVCVFFQNGRDAFFEGEPLRFTVAARAPKAMGSPGELRVVLWDGAGYPIVKRTVASFEGSRSFHFEADNAFTSLLKPGRYRLVPRLAGMQSFPTELEIVSRPKKTHFEIAFFNKYNSLSREFGHLLPAGSDPGQRRMKAIVSDIANLGFNALQDLNYQAFRGVSRSPRAMDLEDLLKLTPGSPVPEARYIPDGMESLLNECVRHNIDYYHIIMTYNDLDLPQSFRPDMRVCRRQGVLACQRLRRFPCLRGMNLWEEVYWGSSVHTANYDLKMKLYADRYRERFGISLKDAKRMLQPQFTSRPSGRRSLTALNNFVSEARFRTDQFAVLADFLDAPTREILNDPQNSIHYYTASNLGSVIGKGYVPSMYRNLEWTRAHYYTDQASSVPLHNMFQAELFRLPGKKCCVYVPSRLNRADCRFGRGEMFGVIGQKVDGFGLWAFPYNWGKDTSGYTAGYQSMYREFLERYGDLLSGLERSYHKVAILNYFTPMALDPHKKVAAGGKVREFWIGCLRAGYPAEIFYEEELAAPGALDSYQVLIVPGIQWEEELSPAQIDFLTKQKDAGKTILVEKDSVLPIDGVVHVDDYVDRIGASKEALFFTWFDFEYWWLIDRSDGITEAMKKALSKILDPIASTDSTRILFGLQGYEDGRYLFVSGYEPPPLKGGGFRQQIPMAPQFRTVSVPATLFASQKGTVCYDVMEMREVPLEDEGKKLSFQADLRYSEGKLYAFLPERVRRVQVKAPSKLTAGRQFQCEVTVLGESGRPLSALVPVEIVLRRPDGEVAAQVYRAAGPAVREWLKVGVNDMPSRWQLTVRELLSGLAASHQIDVTRPASSLALLAGHVKLDERKVIVYDAERISQSLAAKGREISIPLDRDQARLRPLAEKLAGALTRHGLKATVAEVDDLLVPFNPDGNDEYHGLRRGLIQPGFIIEKHAIVIGRRGESRLVESALSQGLLPERLSEHYPGRGRALLAYAWQPFGTQHDSVFVLSQDDAGLQAGIARLVELVTQRSKERYQARAELRLAKSEEPASTSESTGARQVDPYSEVSKLCDSMTVVTAHAGSRRVAIGTAGMQKNVACLDYDGNLLWHRRVPDYDVCRLQFNEDGSKLLTSVKWDNKNYILSAKDGAEIYSVDSLYLERMSGNGHEFQLKRSWPVAWDRRSGRLFLAGDVGVFVVGAEGKLLWSVDLWEQLGEFSSVDETDTKRLWLDWIYGSALSPDGKHFAILQLENLQVAGSANYPFHLLTYRIRCYDATTGKELWSAVTPTFQESHSRRLEFSDDGRTLAFRARTGYYAVFDLEGKELEHGTDGPAAAGPPLDPTEDVGAVCSETTSPGGDTVYRAYMTGALKAFDASTGALRWKLAIDPPCELVALPDVGGVVLGNVRGDVTRVSAEGKALWIVDLAADSIPRTQVEIDRIFAMQPENDVSDQVFGVEVDQDGDLDGIVKFSPNQLVNGDAETPGGWQSSAEKLTIVSPGRASTKALRLAAEEFVDQVVTESIAPLATYLLEFWYRPESPGSALSAAVMANGPSEAVYTMEFTGRAGEWHFGRLAVKSLQDTVALRAGFQAAGGAVAIDDVRLRKLRFPSANYMFSPDVHRLTPIWTEDAYSTFRGVTGTTRSKIQNTVFAPDARSPTGKFVEPAFLQNGRLNDVKSRWYLLPSYQRFTIFLNFKAPTTVSHVAVYFNHLRPQNVVKSFLIYGFDADEKKEVVLRRVRANRKVFCLYKFAPRRLSYVRIYQLGSPDDDRNFTEIEAYGSLAGPEAEKGFPEGEPFVMFNGDPTHTWASIDYDLALPLDKYGYRRFYEMFGRHTTNVQSCPATIAYGLLFLSSAQGVMTAKEMTGRWSVKWQFATRGAAPLSYPALYGGRIIFGCADGMVYCLRADTGSLIWEQKTGGRVVSSPTPTSELVLIGSHDGYLYALDLENGDPVWKFKAGGAVHSSPAVADGKVYFASLDGQLYALEGQTGKLVWQRPLGAGTFSSPSVDSGLVAIGTEGGEVVVVKAGDGQVRRRFAMGDLVGTTPIVRDGRVYAVADNGKIAAYDVGSGKAVWTHQAEGPVRCEPVLLKTQLMVSAGPSLVVLDANTGALLGKDGGLTTGGVKWNGVGMGAWPVNLLPFPTKLHINARPMIDYPIGVAVFHIRAQLFTLWKSPPPEKEPAKK